METNFGGNGVAMVLSFAAEFLEVTRSDVLSQVENNSETNMSAAILEIDLFKFYFFPFVV